MPGRVRQIGYAVLAVQLIAFCAWSTLLYNRYALTWDFAVYHQPWYLIAHGHLDPSTSVESMPFWRNDAEFAIWPLALLYWVGPHSLTLLWLQDIGVVAAELIAFSWMCSIVARCGNRRTAAWLATTGLMLFVVSPWLWWSVSFDFHMESVAMPFAVLLARDLASGRRRMWWWVAPVLSCRRPLRGLCARHRRGRHPVGTWLTGGAASRSSCISVAYSAFIVMIGADHGAPLARHYGYLALGLSASYAHGRLASGAHLSTGQMAEGIIRNPLRIVEVLWQKRVDVNAALLPGGAIGILFRPLAPLIAVGLLSAVLSAGWRFAQPLFQYLPVYLLVPVGTVAVLAWMARRHSGSRGCAPSCWSPRPSAGPGSGVRRCPCTGCGSAVPRPPPWRRCAPRFRSPTRWSPPRASWGRSPGASTSMPSRSTSRTPVSGRDVWFVITPTAGTELQSTASSMAFIGLLAGPMHAKLIAHANGVWAFRWHRPAGQHWVIVPDGTDGVPAWTAAGTGGHADLTGPVRGWHAGSDGREGYVSDGIQWLEPLGRYTTQIVLSASGPANVEVWDDNGNGTLLARRTITAAAGRQSVTLPVDVKAPLRSGSYSGWGPFSAHFVPPDPGQRIEVRVWTDGSDIVKVYSARIQPGG